MGLIEDVSKMQSEGRNDMEIRSMLKQRGVSDSEVEGAISQATIKGAVGQAQDFSAQYGGEQSATMEGEAPPQEGDYYPAQEMDSQAMPAGYEGMEPSLTAGDGQPYSTGELAGSEFQQPADISGGFGGGYGNYPQYQGYQESVSSDVITEIAEQVVSDKLSSLNEKFEEAVNFKNMAEAKLRNVEERIERIEKIFDKLQLSILQRVAEYVEDVKTIKKEVQETQKSFKALSSEKRSAQVNREEKKFRYVE